MTTIPPPAFATRSTAFWMATLSVPMMSALAGPTVTVMCSSWAGRCREKVSPGMTQRRSAGNRSDDLRNGIRMAGGPKRNLYRQNSSIPRKGYRILLDKSSPGEGRLLIRTGEALLRDGEHLGAARSDCRPRRAELLVSTQYGGGCVRERLRDVSPGLPTRHDARIWRGVLRMESRGQELEMGSSGGLGRGSERGLLFAGRLCMQTTRTLCFSN